MRLSFSLPLVFLIAVAGCNFEGSDTADSVSEDFSDVDLGRDTARQLNRVEITGLPDLVDTGSLKAFFREAGQGEPVSTDAELPILVNDDGVFLITPLYDADGVELTVKIESDEKSSKALDLALASLPPPQTGAIEDLVAAIERGIESSLVAMGGEYPETLEYWHQQGFNQMPEPLIPLMQTWLSILDPGNDLAMANREYDEQERELIERVLAERNIISALNNHANRLNNSDNYLEPVALTQGVTLGASRMAQTEAAGRTGQRSITGRTELPGLFTIDGPEALSTRMSQYSEARSIHRSMELFDETVGTYVGLVGLTATVSTMGTGSGASTAGRELVKSRGFELLQFITNGADAAGSIAEVESWFYPCCITEVHLETAPEDATITHEDRAENQLALASVKVDVESQGFNVAREAFDRAFSRMQKEAGNLVNDDVWGGVGQEVENWVRGETQDALMDQLAASELVFRWSGVDIMGDRPQHWVQHDVTTFAAAGEPIMEHADQGAFSPNYEFRLLTPEAFQRQTSMLSVRPDPDLFPQGSWSSVVQGTERVRLEYIDARLEPTVQVVNQVPATVTFDVVVENALDARVDIIDAEGNVVANAEHGDTFSVEVTDPPGSNGYDIEHWALSTSSGGIRGHQGAPERSGVGVVMVRPEEEDDNDDEYIAGGCERAGEWMTPAQWDQIKDQRPAQTLVWLTTHMTDDDVLPELRGLKEAVIYHPTDESTWARFEADLKARSLTFSPLSGSHSGVEQGFSSFSLVASGYQQRSESLPSANGESFEGTVNYWRYVFENERGETIDLLATDMASLVLPGAAPSISESLIDSTNAACEFELI